VRRRRGGGTWTKNPPQAAWPRLNGNAIFKAPLSVTGVKPWFRIVRQPKMSSRRQGREGPDDRSAVHRLAGGVAAFFRPAERGECQHPRRRHWIRRLIDPWFPGDPGKRHAGRPGSDDGLPRSLQSATTLGPTERSGKGRRRIRTTSMSLSWISWKPRIDEPSNPMPSSRVLAFTALGGTEKCCHTPGKSVNRRSII